MGLFVRTTSPRWFSSSPNRSTTRLYLHPARLPFPARSTLCVSPGTPSTHRSLAGQVPNSAVSAADSRTLQSPPRTLGQAREPFTSGPTRNPRVITHSCTQVHCFHGGSLQHIWFNKNAVCGVLGLKQPYPQRRKRACSRRARLYVAKQHRCDADIGTWTTTNASQAALRTPRSPAAHPTLCDNSGPFPPLQCPNLHPEGVTYVGCYEQGQPDWTTPTSPDGPVGTIR